MIQENLPAKNFWIKNGFFETGEKSKNEHGNVILMEKELK